MNARLVSVLALGVVCGCTSYRFSGLSSQGTSARNVATKNHYCVSHLRFNVIRGLNEAVRQQQGENPYAAPDPWSIPQTASLSREEVLLPVIQSAYPSVFFPDGQERLEVDVSSSVETTDGMWSVFCPYLITLGIAPMYQTVHSECAVEVKRIADGSLIGKSTIRFDTNMRMSATSPLGAMIGYDREGGVQSQETGSGVGCWPHSDIEVARKVQKVFAETVADAVVSILMRAETGLQ